MQLIGYWLEQSHLRGLSFPGRDQVQAYTLEAFVLEIEHQGGAI
jgi:hypothetical protein